MEIIKNFGFLYLNKINISKNQKEIFDINTNELIGYVSDDFSTNHHLLFDILNAAHDAYQLQKDKCETRVNKLLKLCSLLKENISTLSLIMSQEIGKRITDCRIEIERSIIYIKDTIDFYHYSFEKEFIIDNEKLTHNNKKVGVFQHIPLGVILGIVPFNFPINLLITKMAPAYLLGNSVIIKPSTKALMTTAFISQLIYDAGINDNSIQFINSHLDEEVFARDIINMITFTGSTKIGYQLSQKAYKIPKVLEMGGKDCCLLLDDCNIEQACNDIIKGAFSYNGQRCTAIKKVLVSQQLFKTLVDTLLNKIQQLTIGNSCDDCDITPLIDTKSIEYVKSLVNDAVSQGANILPSFKIEKNIIYPCLVTNVNNQMRISYEEQFAPILPIQVYRDIDEAIENINNLKYGLQCSIYTNNKKLFNSLADKINVGTINFNGITSRGPDIFPFLGVKESGLGVQGIKDALLSMCRLKGKVYNK